MHVVRECRQTWGPPSPAFAPVPVDYLRMPAFDETTSPSSPCHPVPVNGVFLFLLLLLRLPLLLFLFLLLKIHLSLALLLHLSMMTLSLKPMLERVFSFWIMNLRRVLLRGICIKRLSATRIVENFRFPARIINHLFSHLRVIRAIVLNGAFPVRTVLQSANCPLQ